MPRTILIRITPAWVACVVFYSLFPWRPKLAVAGITHEIGHFLVFGSTTYLLLLIAQSARQRIWAPIAVIALGIAIEYSQHWIFGSPLEWWDMRDDAYGAVAAYLLGKWPALRGVLVRDRG
jgi:ABC-type Fe3+-siderophore transport system permease subunit